MNAERNALWAEAKNLIAMAPEDPAVPARREALLERLLRFQGSVPGPYAELLRSRPPETHGQYPALPTDVFRFARVAIHGPASDVRVFQTSGTTHGARGVHAFRDLGLYDLAAQTAAARHLFRGGVRPVLVMLAPHESEAPDSSLSYMLSRFAEWFGARTEWAFAGGAVRCGSLVGVLRAAERSGEPAAVLGTSYALQFAEEALGGERFALPTGSMIMHTGGFKGRTREVDPATFADLLRHRYGVGDASLVAEYGMTELSSQFYEATDAPVDGETTATGAATGAGPGATGRRPFHVPHWVRVRAVNPETLRALPDGEEGLLRIEDAANVDSCAAIQTSDVGRVDGSYLFLRGRAPGATPRGCSLAAEEALGGAVPQRGAP